MQWSYAAGVQKPLALLMVTYGTEQDSLSPKASFERARQTGLNAENLIVNSCQGVKVLCWRHNGLLPAMSA